MFRVKPVSLLISGFAMAIGVSSLGCSSSIVGAYDGGEMKEGTPFHIARATFKEDNTFTAYAKRPGSEGQVLNGTYDFNGFKLELKQAGKPVRSYGATYHAFTKTLHVKGDDGAEQTLKKM